MEVELKLLVTSQAAQALQKHPLLKAYATSKPRTLKMSDTYFDTPDLHIRRSDAGLRVRRVGKIWVQTLKGGGSVDSGLHSRHEWESKVAGPLPDLILLCDLVDRKSVWSKLLRSQEVAEQLKPIFTTDIKRRVWLLRLPQGDEVEFVLDQGTIEHDGNKVPISEVELELKSGDPMHLFDFALALQQDIPMQIGNLSKADHGYALVATQPLAATKAAPLKLSTHMSIEQVFQAISINCLMQIQVNEAGIRQVHDVESLHQMRVGLRRLRSAFGLFKSVLQAPEELQQELDWLSTQLGAARDWGVLVGATLPAVFVAMPDECQLAEIQGVAQEKAHEMHEAASSAISSPRYTHLILSLARWVQGCGWRDAMSTQDQNHLTERGNKFARSRLAHEHSLLLKRGKKLDGASPKTRHRVRIAAKKMRYATEFFQSFHTAKKVLPFIGVLSTLQEELGWLNDAVVADRLLQQLLDRQYNMVASVSFVRGYLASSVKNDDRKVCMLWKKFVQMELPS